jgi:ComEC/Rec2-related protein
MQIIRAGDWSFGMAAAFLLGVFAANSNWNSAIFFGAGVVIGIAFLVFSQHYRLWKFIATLFLAAVAGVIYYHAYDDWQASHTHFPTGKETTFFTTIREEPQSAGNFMMLTATLSRPYAGTINIFTSSHSQYHYGDLLWLKGTVSASKNADEPLAVFLPQMRVVAQHHGAWWKEDVIAIKSFIIKKFQALFPADQAALLAAIVIGSGNSLSAALKAQMNVSGTSYIVGMYGYKLAILTAVLAAGLKDHVPRKILLLITVVVMASFVVATGASISAIRAAIMAAVALIARGSGRIFNPRNALTFAAFGMILLNATLLTDAAFQLSFLSFLGIYYLGPPIEHLFHWEDKGVLMWKEHAMLSLSTNLAILPVVMNTFGGFSLASFISNILIMIPWPLVMAGGGLIIACGFVSSYAVFFVAQATSILLRYELFIIRIFSVLVFPVPAVFGSAAVIALYYGVLIIFAHYYAAPSQKNN